MTRGRLIVLEGIDGSGTTTQARLLVDALGEVGLRAAHLTNEPTPGPVGVLIRQVLQRRLVASGEGEPLDWRTMALLFAADRMDHNQVLIEPALGRGEWVICDRYTLSSLAYQSLTSPGGKESLPWLREINRHARIPDLTIVLEVSPDVAARRRADRGQAKELFEVDELQTQLAGAYGQASELLPAGHRVRSLDGEQDSKTVHGAVLQLVADLDR